MKETSKVKDSCVGMMLGLAIGDAMGAPVEFELMGDFESVTEYRAGGVFNLPEGFWTDDTSMALCLADSLLEKGGYDSFDVMEKYVAWRNVGYRSSLDYCFDIGNRTNLALDLFENGQNFVKKSAERDNSAGNGTIMRLAPAVIAAFENRTPEEIIKMARISARETHFCEEAEVATEVFAAMLIKAIFARDKSEIFEIAEFSTGEKFDQISERIFAARNWGIDELNASGYAIHGLQVAAWAMENSNSFEEGLLKVVNLGNDADSNGAIFGQLAGAFYGLEEIPEKLVRELFESDEIKELAENLFEMPAAPILKTRFEEDQI